jgi:hypothetical protein
MDGETVKALVFILGHIAVMQFFITAIVWMEVKGARIRRKLLTESEPKRIERRVETKLITETIIEIERIQ